nr:ATP synthase F0 subunit 6 [Wallacea dactyliferae]
MMNNLFSSFDPSTYTLNMNWLSSLISLMLISYSFWLIPSRFSMMFMLINMNLHKELKILSFKSKGNSLLFISLFLFILINNFLGLFPYIFTSTSHMSITLSLALPLWISFMLYGWISHTNYMFAHLVPQGTPPLLMPFMVCIESISNIIRPGTLAIRLSANMIAGHLLMTLLGSVGSSLSMAFINILFLTQILLLTLEMAVSMIQAYVFTILATLYSSETN